MINWFRQRSEKKLEKSGGLQEKKKAIEKTNAVADDVLQKVRQMGGERRHEAIPLQGPDRRLRMA